MSSDLAARLRSTASLVHGDRRELLEDAADALEAKPAGDSGILELPGREFLRQQIQKAITDGIALCSEQANELFRRITSSGLDSFDLDALTGLYDLVRRTQAKQGVLAAISKLETTK